MYKKLVVEKDPTEKGERAILNFGHTIDMRLKRQRILNFYMENVWHFLAVAAAFISFEERTAFHGRVLRNRYVRSVQSAHYNRRY